MIMSLRDVLMQPLPLATTELIPKSLALQPGEVPLSDDPLPGYYHLSVINKYVPWKHKILVDATLRELADFSVQHGIKSSYHSGCRGPLCKRAYRHGYRQYRPSQASNIDLKPQYSAVEPLLENLQKFAKTLVPVTSHT